ncbi:hypothetical protein HMPREF1250_1479 [Megasphaera vaginalis (ex Srinivasan et al. 2021)]|uniref:Uncharacterized protein n=1 Tax=Megasphaera vaginalis (ex Srinivasan et al. 2021) TaxID=1111454 RepID=U7UIQ8_9FIRM|nr:hypothetical protein HMPREF1250_1479 [Megasphaera vaginalis (ex Srinivasan et al. 2021)]
MHLRNGSVVRRRYTAAAVDIILSYTLLFAEQEDIFMTECVYN